MLGIRVEKVCDFIVRARELDAKVEAVEPEPGSNMSDDDFRAVLESHGDDPVYEELSEFLDSLNEEEKTNLVALAWLGRGDFTAGDWADALGEARRNRGRRRAVPARHADDLGLPRRGAVAARLFLRRLRRAPGRH